MPLESHTAPIHDALQPRIPSDWFNDWFNSPYYQALYDHRDLVEAQNFVQKLTRQIPIPNNAEVLDLGCGWGRHTCALADLGYHVTGLDLSPNLIAKAKHLAEQRSQKALGSLNFEVGDMRSHHTQRNFDLVVNLFTSFGYFEDPNDDLRVLQNAGNHLKPEGYLVLDYFDPGHTLAHLVPSEIREFPQFRAQIKRRLVGQNLVKEIRIQDHNMEKSDTFLEFSEKVRCYSPDELRDLLHRAGFQPIQRWNGYDLRSSAEPGPRCIWLVQKNKVSAEPTIQPWRQSTKNH
jgi:SAM-dependent methyltransferase